MPDPLDTHRTAANPADLSASAAGDRDDTSPGAPRGGTPHFGPASAAGEVGTLGPYRVLKELGKGGMGAVYLAVDTRLGRKVALKVMLPESAADRQSRERFLREARAAALVSHDHVVTVFEADERGGVPYIAMQLLQGYPLDEYLKHKGLPPLAHAVRIGREAALGLAAAHALGMVHRDVKPANLWLESPNGRVKVLDFGLAKPVGTDTELTKSGAVIGTPAFMSPEQARGQKVDHRTDLFSLGAVLYRLCAGRAPFEGEHVMAVLAALIADEPAPVRSLNPAVPEPLAQLIHALLAKNPAHRPQTATEVAEWLRMLLDGTLPPGAEVSASVPAVVPLPAAMQVTAVPQSAFANLTDDADDDDATEQADAPAPPRKSGRGLLLAAVGAVLLAGAVVAVVVPQIGKKPAPATAEAPSRAEPGRGPTPPTPPRKKDDANPANPAAKDIPAKRPPKPWIPPAPVPVGQSPFDKLDPAAIPKEERFDWQPKELVAVAGTHSPRTWTNLRGEPDLTPIAVSPDGALFAIGGAISGVQVWDVKRRAVVAELAGDASALAFSPDGRFLTGFVAHPLRYVRWDLANPNGAPVDWTNGLPADNGVHSLSLAPDGGRIAARVSKADTSAIVYDMTAMPPKELARTPAHIEYEVKASGDCTRYAHYTAEAKSVVVYDVTPTGAKERLRAESPSARLALSSDGSKLVTHWADRLRFWDLTADAPVPVEFAPRTMLRWPLAFSPDGKRLVTQDVDCALRLWDTSGPNPAPVWSAPLPLRGINPTLVTRLAFAGAAGRTLVAVTWWGMVHFIDVSGAEPKVLNPIAPSEPIGPELAIDGATGRVALGRAEDGRRQVWDFAGPKPTPTEHTLPGGLFAHTPEFKTAVVWENDGTSLFVDGKPRSRLTPRSEAGVFSADGRRYWGQTAWRGSEGGRQVTAWDVSGDAPRQLAQVTLPPGGHPTWWYRLVRNDTVLAMQSGGSLIFADVTGDEPKLLSELAAGPGSRVFPDGERVLAQVNVFPHLLGLRDGVWTKVWDGPGDQYMQYAAHPSGRYFALYSQGEITVRRAADGTVVRAIPFAKAPPQKLEFAPDGRHLFVVNGFNTVYVLRIPGLDVDPVRVAAEMVLAFGGRLNVKGGAREIRAADDLPREPFVLTRVYVTSPDMTDAAAAHIGRLNTLTELILEKTKVSDAGLVHFKGLTALTHLYLGGTQITGAGFENIRGFTSLTDLALFATPVDDAGLEHLKELKTLERIELGHTRVSDAGLVHLKGLPKLTAISLAVTKVSGAGMAHLSEIKSLTNLSLDGTQVDDAGLVHLEGLKSLTLINLASTRVTAAGVQKFADALPNCTIMWNGGKIEPKKP